MFFKNLDLPNNRKNKLWPYPQKKFDLKLISKRPFPHIPHHCFSINLNEFSNMPVYFI